MRKRRLAVFLLIILALSVLMLLGQKRLTVSRYDCSIAGLPDEFAGYRIVQLSDLHGAEFGKGNSRLLERVEGEDPDLIVLTGDFIEDKDDLAATGVLLPALAEIAPCYFISGNHEWASGGMPVLEAQLERAGVNYLSNEFTLIKKGDAEIVLCGAEDPNSWADLATPDILVESAAAAHDGSPIILLGHRNYWVREYPSLPVELIFCGHGHGGIVRIPGVGGLVGTDRLLFPDYTEGVFASGSYQMIVSRGLGSIYGLPRIFNPPEIVVATLEKE